MATKFDKLVFPSAEAKIKLKVEGLFGTPDDWKTTDDANPGLFTYAIKFSKF